MVYKLADNIISPLGFTTHENYLAVKSGKSALCLHADAFGTPEPFFGSLMDYGKAEENYLSIFSKREGYDPIGVYTQFTEFEQYCLFSVLSCITTDDIKRHRTRIMLFLSSTKGNVGLLAEDLHDKRYYLSESARRIAIYLGIKKAPVVVSNACISGVSAQIAAYRAIESGRCDYAIVVGADTLSKFIVSGFQSFKALSTTQCKPFDTNRVGLNLGEAVGTIILGKDRNLIADCENGQTQEPDAASRWHVVATSIHNDANHISGPSRTGEGAYRVLSDLIQSFDKDQLAFINAHGTATLYNDEMESIAIHRAGLENLPVNALKGYYGHTLGAAGVIETILSMAAVDDSNIIATKGYEQCGTTYPLNVSPDNRPTDKRAFIKILSGFGGSNAGILWEKGGAE